MKASNIFQKLKTQGFGTDGSKPAIPGIKTPLSMKDSPLDKALVGNQKNLPEHLKAKIEAAPAKMYGKPTPAKKYSSDAQRKAVHASKAEKKSSPTTMKAKGDNGKAKEVKAQSITTDLKAGTRTRYFSEEDQKKYGVPAQVTSKIVKSSPATMKGKPKVAKQTKKKGNKTITVENFNYGDQFTSKVKTKQKNKKDGEAKVKVKVTSKNYDPTTGRKTGRSVTKAKARLETYNENVSPDPSEGTVKKSNIVSLKKSYKSKGSSKLKGKVTGSGSKRGIQSVTGKGLDKSLDNINKIDVRKNLESPAKKSCSPMKMETETMAGPGNPKKAMRKAKRRATKATNVMQRAMNACKRNTRGKGSTYRN